MHPESNGPFSNGKSQLPSLTGYPHLSYILSVSGMTRALMGDIKSRKHHLYSGVSGRPAAELRAAFPLFRIYPGALPATPHVSSPQKTNKKKQTNEQTHERQTDTLRTDPRRGAMTHFPAERSGRAGRRRRRGAAGHTPGETSGLRRPRLLCFSGWRRGLPFQR